MTTTQFLIRKERLVKWLKTEFSLQHLAKNLNAALLLYLLAAILAISFAALIFSGPLSGEISSAISLFLIGNALLVLFVALLSSNKGSIAIAQDTPAVLLALPAASIVSATSAGPDDVNIFATVLVMVIGSTLLMGLIFLFMGIFRIGSFVRFLPYPVMGGFLAGTGWLLVQGGIGVMTNLPFGMGILDVSVSPFWLSGFMLAGMMLFTTHRIKSAWVLPVYFVSTFFLFYIVMALLKIPLSELFVNGWLLGPFSAETGWTFPLSAITFSEVDWQIIFLSLGLAAPVFLICPVAFLLNVSSLELISRREIDINRELITTGFGNLASGLLGGIIGYHAISLTSLNQTISKGSRLPGILTACLLGLTVYAGVSFLSYIPRILLGSLVVYIGLALLYDWVFKVWATFPKIDIFIILAILATIVLTNFLWGILVGMVMTIVMFVISYSKINIVKHSLSGKTKRSRVTRPPAQTRLLRSVGDQLCIYKLEGFIFFGTAKDLYDRIRQRVLARDQARVRYFLLDFAQVPGLDSTGLLNFQKIMQLAQENNVQLILTGLTGRVRDQFYKGGYVNQTPGLRLFSDMDHGIEWYEEHVISSAELEDHEHLSLVEYLMAFVSDTPNLARLIQYMERREVSPGEYLIRQGDDSGEIFLIESGQVTAQIEAEGKKLRLETMTGGRIVGEVGFFLKTPRTASVIVDQPGVVYSMTHRILENIKKEDPQALETFQLIIIHLLGERVTHLTRALNDLQQSV
jgi:sulfate permease, SulP family